MKPLPAAPPLILIAIVCLAVVLTLGIDHAQAAGWYEVWKDNQTFVAAMIALGSAIWAGRAVYRQLKAQNAQAAIELLTIVSREIEEIESEIDILQRASVVLRHLSAMTANSDNTDVYKALVSFKNFDFPDLFSLIRRTGTTARTPMIGRACNAAMTAQNKVEQSQLAKGVISAVKPKSQLFNEIKDDLSIAYSNLTELSQILAKERKAARDRRDRLHKMAHSIDE